jgi:membrane-associated protease RseP (regulator of RpoE activity)
LESSRVWKKTRKQLHQGWKKAFENLESVIENGIDQRRNRQADCGLYGLHPVSVTRSSKSHKVVQGLLIEGVDPNGPAASAGLAAGDILTRIGPIKTPSFALYLDALRRYRPGKTTSLTFIRDAQKKTVRIQFGQNPTFPIPATTSALAEAVQNTYFALQDTLHSMLENTSEFDCEFRPQQYAWSANDILAHLIALEREVQNSIAAATEGQETGLFFGPPLKISRQAKKYSFPSTAALFDELKRSQLETVSLLTLLPVEFQERKGSYWRLATNLFETQLHMRAYIASLGRTLHAAQDLSVQ